MRWRGMKNIFWKFTHSVLLFGNIKNSYTKSYGEKEKEKKKNRLACDITIFPFVPIKMVRDRGIFPKSLVNIKNKNSLKNINRYSLYYIIRLDGRTKS